MSKHIVIIGASAAGLAAATRIKKESPDSRVTIIDKDANMPYRRPSITGIIEGTLDLSDIAIYSREIESLGIKLFKGSRVSKIIPSRSVIKVVNPNGSEDIINYNSLIIATGAEARFPSVEGSNLNGVFIIRKAEDAIKISKYLEQSRKVAVVGAAFVALLVTEALVRRELKTYLIIRSRVLRRLVGESASEVIEKYLQSGGVILVKGVTVSKIVGDKKVEKISLSDGSTINVDCLIFAIGANPETELASEAGIKTEHGIIDVDRYMETSVSGIYAAGDCSFSWDSITKSKVYNPIASIASSSGEIAGLNAIDKHVEAPYSLRFQYEKILGLEIITAGYTYEECKKSEISAEYKDLSEEIKEQYPLWRSRILKMDVVTRGKGEILGFQIIGRENARMFASPFLSAMLEDLKLEDALKLLNAPIPSLTSLPMPYKKTLFR